MQRTQHAQTRPSRPGPEAARVLPAAQAGRYASPTNRGTSKPREYTQTTGSVGGSHFWWSCTWAWKNGRKEACAHGEAASAERATQLATEHAAEIHTPGASQ